MNYNYPNLFNGVNNFDLILSCFSQYVFAQAKEAIDDLKFYFGSNPATSGNVMINSLLDAIEKNDLENIGIPIFNTIFAKCQTSTEESRTILERVKLMKSYTREQMAPVRKLISDIVASTYIIRANSRFADDPTEFVNYLKSVNMKSSGERRMSSTNFSDIDINTIIAEENDNVVQSKFEFINNSFPNGGYPRASTVIVSAPPGVGKSLFLTEESMWMALHGTKVLYGIFGDIGLRDMLIRMCAIHSGYSFFDANRNLVRLYKELRDALRGNFEISVNPAGMVSVEEFVEFGKNNDHKVIVADYDSNIVLQDKTDSMYDLYGKMYMKFSELVADPYNKLLFVASQPKINAWNESVIGLTDIGESSRKQHAADMIITKGKEINSPNHLSIINIPKNRRGETDLQAYSIRLNNGRTKIIPKAIFQDLKNIQEKKDFSEAEIDQMIRAYMQTRGNVNRNIQQRMAQQNMGGQPNIPPGPSPFSY